jgi:hypothetical protein
MAQFCHVLCLFTKNGAGAPFEDAESFLFRSLRGRFDKHRLLVDKGSPQKYADFFRSGFGAHDSDAR